MTRASPGIVYGFVMVTAPAESAMLDVHDRRPLVLTLEEAKVWLDPVTTLDEALHLANTPASRPMIFTGTRFRPR